MTQHGIATLEREFSTSHNYPADLSPEAVASYRENGFVHVPGVLSPEEVEEFQAAALRLSRQLKEHGPTPDPIFQQMVNVWQQDETLRRLTLHRTVAVLAEKLAGVPLRLWHDQVLIKEPRKSKPTEFHQDQPYWPHLDSPQPISAWIALCDVPVERGCMTFIPGSHKRTDLPMQSFADARSLFTVCPDLQWEPRVTVPLKAGDCTFHHGRCAHMATPNDTDEPRVAQVVIFMDQGVRYSGRPHIVTNPLNLPEGAPLDGELFPAVEEYLAR